MANKIITALAYHTPDIFRDRETLFGFLTKCGLKRPLLHRGKLLYLLNHLRVTSHLRSDRYNANDWVSIKTSIIRDLFGNLKDYKKIINQLMVDGFIEVYKDEKGKEFSPGKSCKKYRLSSLLNDLDWKVIRVPVYSCKIATKVARYCENRCSSIDLELYKMLQQFHIEDVPIFENTTINTFISSGYPEVLIFRKQAEKKVELNQRKRRERRENFTVELSMREKYRAYKDAYLAMKEGGSTLRHQPDKYGRRHTNITNLPKILRDKLYIVQDGERKQLREVDVKNSQVLLLLTILDKSLRGYSKFKEIVEAGVFYEFLGSRMGKEKPLSEDDRKKIKQQFFLVIYGENLKYVYDTKVYQIMHDEFPELVDFLVEFKRVNGYELPARLMQATESNIIIHFVANEGIKRGLLFTQIYDSILCLAEDVETFNSLVKQGFLNHGLNATTNIDLLNPQKTLPIRQG